MQQTLTSNKPFHLKITTRTAISKQRRAPTLMISSMKYTWLTGSLFFIRTFCRCCTWKNVTRNLSVVMYQFCKCSFCNRYMLFTALALQPASGLWSVFTCLHAAHIWSISFSRLVQRAARKAAVFPGVGRAALPGAAKGCRFAEKL